MEYNNRIEEVVLELDGIKFTLYLLGDAFSKGNCKWDNETISGTIQAIAHRRRTSDSRPYRTTEVLKS